MKRVLAAMAVLMLAAACSSPDTDDPSAAPTRGDISLIEVGTSDTAAPSIEWPEGLDFTDSQTKVMWEGEGEPLVDGQSLLLDVYVQSLDTGQVLENTFDGLPRSFLLAPELLGDDLYKTLLELNVGARVVSVSPPAGEFADEPAIAIVIDVLSDKAVGETMPVRDDVPTVTSAVNGAPQVTFDPDQELPTELVTVTLIEGHGPQVEQGSFIVAQFLAVYAEPGSKDGTMWTQGALKQTTWTPERAPWEGPIGTGKAIRAFDEGLLDQTAGSRVLLVVPESWGYPGEGTLVYVVDILDVWNAE